MLAASDNEVKHIIVLADGADAEQQEGGRTIEELTAEGITVSMVSIGVGPDTPWLQAMAELGGGRFHLTDQAANLPQIHPETLAIQRKLRHRGTFFPTQTGDHPILTGITATPPLYGYVGASQATAQTPLVTHLGDPLLATWQYGCGRSVAWTSDATGRWGVTGCAGADSARSGTSRALVVWGAQEPRAVGLGAADGETARLVVDAGRRPLSTTWR